jgi:hypothetical protein
MYDTRDGLFHSADILDSVSQMRGKIVVEEIFHAAICS